MKYSYANAKPVNLRKIDYWLRVGQCGCHKTDYEPNLMDKRKFMAELRRDSNIMKAAKCFLMSTAVIVV